MLGSKLEVMRGYMSKNMDGFGSAGNFFLFFEGMM